MDVIDGIKEAQATKAALEKLLQDMDPASGVSIAFRRGVARDNEDQENDARRRPWTTVETGNLILARAAIMAAIEATSESISFRLRNARELHTRLGDFLAMKKD